MDNYSAQFKRKPILPGVGFSREEAGAFAASASLEIPLPG
jgi:hypothetical protein